jgi:hypothetical protein
MSMHSSVSTLAEEPHETETIQITISDALRRRAQAVLNDRSIDPEIICRSCDDSAAALFALMGTIETPRIPNYSQRGEAPCLRSLRRVEPVRHRRRSAFVSRRRIVGKLIECWINSKGRPSSVVAPKITLLRFKELRTASRD